MMSNRGPFTQRQPAQPAPPSHNRPRSRSPTRSRNEQARRDYEYPYRAPDSNTEDWPQDLRSPPRHGFGPEHQPRRQTRSERENQQPSQPQSDPNPSLPRESPQEKKKREEWQKWAVEAKAEYAQKGKGKKKGANDEIEVTGKNGTKVKIPLIRQTRQSYHLLEILRVAGNSYMRSISMDLNRIPLLFQLGLQADPIFSKDASNDITDIHQAASQDKDDEDPEDDTPFDDIPEEMKTAYLDAYEDLKGRFPELHSNLVNCIVYDDEEMLTILINVFREGFRQARKNDSLKLKERAPQYLLRNPQVKIDDLCCDPHIDSCSKHGRGPKHPLIAPQLATGSYIHELSKTKNLKKRKKLAKQMANEFKKTPPNHDALFGLMYDLSAFKKGHVLDGLYRGEFIFRCWRSIFMGHSAAMNTTSSSNRPSIAKINRLASVTPASIAYTITLAYHALMPEDKWRRIQGKFDYFALYRNVLRIFKGASPAFVKEVMDEWDKQVSCSISNSSEEAPDEDSPIGLCIAAAAAYEPPPATDPSPEENSDQPQQQPAAPEQPPAIPNQDPSPQDPTPDDDDDAPHDNNGVASMDED